MALSVAGCGTMAHVATPANVGTPANTVTADKAIPAKDQPLSHVHWKQFPPPTGEETIRSLNLFGTYYYTPTHPYIAGGIPIRDLAGQTLGPRISAAAFCAAANEGAFRAASLPAGRPNTFTFAGAPSDSASQASCSEVFNAKLVQYTRGEVPENWPSIVGGLERSRFRKTTAPYGYGSGTSWLVPWRTIATNNAQIQPGTVIYVPQVRGAQVVLPSGQTVAHDGYFLAADSGGGIGMDHVDFFTGLVAPGGRAILPGIDGKERPFLAYMVNSDKVASYLKGLHRMD